MWGKRKKEKPAHHWEWPCQQWRRVNNTLLEHDGQTRMKEGDGKWEKIEDGRERKKKKKTVKKKKNYNKEFGQIEKKKKKIQ